MFYARLFVVMVGYGTTLIVLCLTTFNRSTRSTVLRLRQSHSM